MPLYRDIPYLGPPRWYDNTRTTKKLVVIHCTANTASAEAEASYARRRTDSVSSHYYVDDDSIVQSLNTDLIAFHAGNRPGNTGGISYEITGQVTWTRQRWLADPDDIHLAARQIARDCTHWRIPARWLTVAQLRAGWAGLTTHNDVRLAWGGTHTDPGPGFPRDILLSSVQRALQGVDMTPDEHAALIDKILRGSLTPDNALYYWLRGIAVGYNPLSSNRGPLTDPVTGRQIPGLPQLGDKLAALDADLEQVKVDLTAVRQAVEDLEVGRVDPAALATALAPHLEPIVRRVVDEELDEIRLTDQDA